MPMCVPMRTTDDFWSTVKRDESNLLLCQRNELLGGVYRICVADDSGGTLLQIAASRTQDSCDTDWQWALGVLAAESKRGRVPQPDKLATAFITLWNKVCDVILPIAHHLFFFKKNLSKTTTKKPSSHTQAHGKSERQQILALPDAKQFSLWGAEIEKMAEDATRADDTACRVLHVADHFDSHGYPVTIGAASPYSVSSSPSSFSSSSRASASHCPQRATVVMEYNSARQIQERRLRLALNSYRSVIKQPQSIPGQQQRLARTQLRSFSKSTDSLAIAALSQLQQEQLSLPVPPQPQRTPPRPQSQLFPVVTTGAGGSVQRQPTLYSSRRAAAQAQLWLRTQQLGSGPGSSLS